MVRTSGKSITQIARDLGIADSSLHHWCKVFGQQGDQAFPGSGHQMVQEEEIRRLKRKLETRWQERDSLKKWSASTRRSPGEVSLYRPACSGVSRENDVPGPQRLRQQVLRLETASTKSAAASVDGKLESTAPVN